MRARLCMLGNTLILAGCASPYVEVSHVHPHLTGAPAAGSLAAAEFTPADEFDVGGKYVTERITRYGIGAPIVAVSAQWRNYSVYSDRTSPAK